MLACGDDQAPVTSTDSTSGSTGLTQGQQTESDGRTSAGPGASGVVSTGAPDSTGGPVCGDGMIDGSDICDGDDLGGEDCVSKGFSSGSLVCAADCVLDVSACSNCGNNAIEDTDVCDGSDLGDVTCTSLGFDSGELRCDADCLGFDLSGCVFCACGDGVVCKEDCDGSVGNETCVSQGFEGGDLSCSAACEFDTSACF